MNRIPPDTNDNHARPPDLSELIDIDSIRALMDEFYRLTHIGVAILDLDGTVLVATGWQDICVRFHRVHPETARNCLESDLELSGGIEPGTFRLHKCKNHLWDMATPIVVGDRKIGNLYLGQFLFDDEPVDTGLFRKQAETYGFDPEAYIAALEKVPRWSKEMVNTAMRFYTQLATLRDICEKKQMEARIRQSEKIEALGALAAGIAHDFNNILFPLIGHAEMLREDFSGDARIRESADEILHAAGRAGELVRQILTLSCQDTLGRCPVNRRT